MRKPIKNPALILAVMFCSLLWACGGDDGFSIDGSVAGKRTMNLRVAYMGNDNVNSILTAARDGVFTFEGTAPDDGALVEFMDNDYKRLGCVYVRNGDKIKVTLDPVSPYSIHMEGNDVCDSWQKWIDTNREALKKGEPEKTNALVARYVRSHPDDVLSTLLLVSEYDAGTDPAGAEKLADAIHKEARPEHLTGAWIASNSRTGNAAVNGRVLPIQYVSAKDTLATFRPRDARYSLLAFSVTGKMRSDSIVPALRRIGDSHRKKDFAVFDLSLDEDTMTWRRGVRKDSVTWATAWVAGSVAAPGVDRLGIPAVPYFIVTDSLGTQLYRGRSLKRAETMVDSLLKIKK